MDGITGIFQRKAANFERLTSYGFSQIDDTYLYKAVLQDSGFVMTVRITKQGAVSATVTDPALGEPYTLHLAAGAGGSFVGKVKAEYEQILTGIADSCFEPEVFKSRQANEVIDFVRKTYGDEPEYLWEKFPDNAIWRRKDTAKWYGALLTVSRRKLKIKSDDMAEIIDLRILPEKMEQLIDNKIYFPGWHMNKKSWYTIILDGSVTISELEERISESYLLATK